MQQNQSHQIDEGAHGEHFRPKMSHKKLITYPLNPEISQGELGTSPPFVPVKEQPLAVTLRMSRDTPESHPRFALPGYNRPIPGLPSF